MRNNGRDDPNEKCDPLVMCPVAYRKHYQCVFSNWHVVRVAKSGLAFRGLALRLAVKSLGMKLEDLVRVGTIPYDPYDGGLRYNMVRFMASLLSLIKYSRGVSAAP